MHLDGIGAVKRAGLVLVEHVGTLSCGALLAKDLGHETRDGGEPVAGAADLDTRCFAHLTCFCNVLTVNAKVSGNFSISLVGKVPERDDSDVGAHGLVSLLVGGLVCHIRGDACLSLG